MLKDSDIIYSGDLSKGTVMAIALGLDGEIVHTIPTYTFFYDAIKKASSIVCVTEDCSTIDFLNKDGSVFESLTTNSFLGSILASSPVVFELMRRLDDNSAVKDMELFNKFRFVTPGWTYSGKNIIPPKGWTPPKPPTSEDRDKLKLIQQR